MDGHTPESVTTAPGCWRSAVRRALDGLAWLLRGVIVALALGMLVLLAWQIFMRFVVGQALSWSEELALTGFTWAMLLATALGVRESIHVRMEILVDAMPAPLRRWGDKLTALLVLALGGCLAWAGWNYAHDSLGTTSAAVAYPMAWLYAAAPVSGALMAVFALEQLVLGRAQSPVAFSVAVQDETP